MVCWDDDDIEIEIESETVERDCMVCWDEEVELVVDVDERWVGYQGWERVCVECYARMLNRGGFGTPPPEHYTGPWIDRNSFDERGNYVVGFYRWIVRDEEEFEAEEEIPEVAFRIDELSVPWEPCELWCERGMDVHTEDWLWNDISSRHLRSFLFIFDDDGDV